MAGEKYELTISRNTVDKLGVKLYDKASDVVSELIANAYDADAENVTVTAPLGEFLATKKDGVVTSKDLKIIVEDDGHGFTEDEANRHYLNIGKNRRNDRDRGDKSREFRRPVMGRKGIGKLAAFGVCETVEVWSASGKKGTGPYPVSHFILRYNDIAQDTDETYYPEPGPQDETLSEKRGTKITLSDFLYKKVPDAKTFRRQLARKFGIESKNFKILVTNSATGEARTISKMDIERMDGTTILVDKRPVQFGEKKLWVSGWIAYAKQSYRNEEFAGVRIYARGKLVATSRDFGHKSGFTGEFQVRSYMIGAVHADWLDEDEDLITTDRQDILWSSDMGQALQKWGQSLMKELGKKSLKPVRKKSFETFKERSGLERHARERYGATSMFDAAMVVGKELASDASEESLQDEDRVKWLLELILMVAPHKTIVDKLKQLADEVDEKALSMIVSLFGDTKIAEIASLGHVAMERVRVIDVLEKLTDPRSDVPERELQLLLQDATWLIDPRWTVLQANQTLDTFRTRFEAWYEGQTGNPITTVAADGGSRRPDFIMMSIENNVEIVEIKRPGRRIDETEFDRLCKYIEHVCKFFKKNAELSKSFSGIHATLICDDINLHSRTERIYNTMIKDRELTCKTWTDLLHIAKHAHNDFLKARDETFRNRSEN